MTNLDETQEQTMAKWQAEKAAFVAMPREEFLTRFKAQMVAAAGEKFDDGSSIAEYADEVGPSYYEDVQQRGEGPENCADADISYWGE